MRIIAHLKRWNLTAEFATSEIMGESIVHHGIGCVDRLVDRNIRNGLGQKEAMVEVTCDGRRSISYNDLFHVVCYFAKIFRSRSMTPLNVAIVGESSLETISLWLGLMRAGHCVLLVPTDQTESHYKQLWQQFKPDSIYVDKYAHQYLGDPISDVTKLLDSISRDYADLNHQCLDDYSDTRPALCLRTSGSTGQAKICVHAHKNIAYFDKLIIQSYWGLEETDRIMPTAGPFFSFGLQGIYCPLLVGATIVTVPNRESIIRYLEVMESEKVSVCLGVPTLYNILLEKSEHDYDLSPLRLSLTAGERMPDIVRLRWEKYSCSCVLDSIGTTETFTPYLTESISRGKGLQDIDGLEYKWRNSIHEGASLYTVDINSPAMMIGYYGSDNAYKLKYFDAPLKTNDLFEKTKYGYSFSSRSTEQIKVSGQWVAPQELEEYLVKDPRVLKVCAVAIKTENGLTRLRAYIVLKPKYLSHCGHVIDDMMKMADNLRPKALKPDAIYIVDDIPQTASGKILRKELESTINHQPLGAICGAIF